MAANPVLADFYRYHCTPHRTFGMVGSIQVHPQRLLSVSNFTAGQTGSIDVSGSQHGRTILLGYSLAGAGPTSIDMGTLALSPPFTQLPPLVADASGNASMTVNLPAGLAGTTVHLHGAELFSLGGGLLTTPVTTTL